MLSRLRAIFGNGKSTGQDLSDAYLAAIVEGSDDAIVGKTLDGIVTSWNAGAERIFGYTAKELIGRPITTIFPEDRLSEEPRILDTLKRGQRIDHFDSQRKTKDGRVIDVSITASPIRDRAGRIIGASKIARDITVQKEMGERLRKSEQRYRSLFENNLDSIFSLDALGYFDSANPASVRLSGYTMDELKDTHFLSLTPPENRPEAMNAFRQGLCSKCSDFETILLRKDGVPRNVFVTGAPVIIDEQVVGVSCIARDITARKETEQQLRATQLAAEKANLAKDQFLALLSHELRNPLNPIFLVAEDALLDPKLPPEQLKQWEMVHKNISLQARLIDDIMDVSLIERHKMVLDLRKVAAQTVLEDALSIIAPDIAAKHIELTVGLNESPIFVRADAVRLQQVLWNVLRNAVKFTPARGRITVQSEQVGASWVCNIQDTGIGMRQEELDRVFQPFFQGSRQTGGRFGGAGARTFHRSNSGRDVGWRNPCGKFGSLPGLDLCH